MSVKIKFKLAALQKSMPKVKEHFNKSILGDLGNEINREIKAGKSPVRGVARFQDYSNSYKAKIKEGDGVKGTDGSVSASKRLRPVNLFVSGAMQNSQRTRETNGKIRVSYLSKFAAYHNEGTNKMPRRPMLPTKEGELFSRTIFKFLFDKAKKAVAFVIK